MGSNKVWWIARIQGHSLSYALSKKEADIKTNRDRPRFVLPLIILIYAVQSVHKYQPGINMAKNTTRLTIDLSNEIDEKLTDIAKRNGITKAEAMRRAFALLTVADQEKQKKGFSLGIVRERDDHTLEAVGRVVGI